MLDQPSLFNLDDYLAYPKIIIYADGAISNGNGGWCSIIYHNTDRLFFSGGTKHCAFSTDMTLWALRRAFDALIMPCEILVKTFDGVAVGLLSRGFKRSEHIIGICNLIDKIILEKKHSVRFVCLDSNEISTESSREALRQAQNVV